MVAELKKLRTENTGLKAQVAAQQGTIDVLNTKVELMRERGDFFKDAAQQGLKIGNNTFSLEARYQQEINDFKQENQRLRWDNDKLRSSRNKAAFVGGSIGLGVGILTCHR